MWPLSQIPELIHRQHIQPLARWKTVSLHQFRIVPSPSVLFSQLTHLEIRVVPNLDLIGTFSGAKVGVKQLLLFHMQNNEWTAVNEVCKSVQILSGSKLPFLKLCLTVLGWDDDHSLRHLACLLSCYHYVSTTSRVVLSAVQNIQANIWFHQMWRLQKPKKNGEIRATDCRPNLNYESANGLANKIQDHNRETLWTECTGTIQINRAALCTTDLCSDACSYMRLSIASEDKQIAYNLEY